MEIDVLTLFPRMLEGFVSESIMGRAIQSGHVNLQIHDIRAWSQDVHHTVDDRPFGGGAGMLLKPDVLFEALQSVQKRNSYTIYLSPEGTVFSTKVARRLSQKPHLILLSGHYEGIDERIREHCIDEEISIGDYILTNGTLPAAVLIDAVVRYLPDVLGDAQSLEQDSFNKGLLSFPQYTRPVQFHNWIVPEILVSGNHEAIEIWRLKKQLIRTLQKRPDLIFN